MIDGLCRVGLRPLSETVLQSELPVCRRQALCRRFAVEQVRRFKIRRCAVPAVLGEQVLPVGIVVFCGRFCPFECFFKMPGRVQQVHQADLRFGHSCFCRRPVKRYQGFRGRAFQFLDICQIVTRVGMPLFGGDAEHFHTLFAVLVGAVRIHQVFCQLECGGGMTCRGRFCQQSADFGKVKLFLRKAFQGLMIE